MKKILPILALMSLATIDAPAQSGIYTYTYTDADGYTGPVYGNLRRVSPNGLWAAGGDEDQETMCYIVNTNDPTRLITNTDGYITDIDDNGMAVGSWYERVGQYTKYKRAAYLKDGVWTRLPLPESVIGQSAAVAISADSRIICGHAMCMGDDPEETAIAGGKYYPVVWTLDDATGEYQLTKVYQDLYLPGTMGFFVYDMTPDGRYICGIQTLDMGDSLSALLDTATGELTIWHKIEYREDDGMLRMFVDGIQDGYETGTYFGSALLYANDRYIFGSRDIVVDAQPDGTGVITHRAACYDLATGEFIDGRQNQTYLCGTSPEETFTTSGYINCMVDGDPISTPVSDYLSTYAGLGANSVAGVYCTDRSSRVWGAAAIIETPVTGMIETPVLVILDQGAFNTFDPYKVISVTPAAGVVSSLANWSITFAGEWGLEDRASRFTLTGPAGVEIPALRSGSDGNGYNVSLADDAVITAPGTYTFTIPAGKFMLSDGSLNPTMTYTYTIPGDTDTPEYVITPEPGTYTSLNDGFSLAFDADEVQLIEPSVIYLQGPEQMIPLYVEVPNNSNKLLMIPVDDAGNPMVLDLPGYYTLVVGAGAVSLNGVTNGTPMRFIYQIDSAITGTWDGTFTADPAADSTVEILKNIDLTFTDASLVVVSDYAAPADFPHLYNTATGEVVCTGTVFASNNVLMISLTKQVTAGGDYRLEVPAALIRVDGATLSAPLTVNYHIDGPQIDVEYTITATPAAGSIIDAEASVTLTFAGAEIASVANDPFAWGQSAPHFTNAEGNFCPNLLISTDGMSFTLSHPYPFEAEGDYTLVIPAGYFTVTTTSGATFTTDTIKLTYTVSLQTSITDIDADAQTAPIFTITGVKVEAPSAPGIYIINGKKTFINR